MIKIPFTFSVNDIRAWNCFKHVKNIVITSHVHPDGDAIGSALALYNYYKYFGKNVSIVIDDEIPQTFEILPGYYEICRPEKIMKTDLLVIVDTNITRIGKTQKCNYDIILNIDHHKSASSQYDYGIIKPEKSSVAEIILNAFILQKFDINVGVANCLYMGLATDTGYFRFPSTTQDSFIAAAKLKEIGADTTLIARATEEKEANEIDLITKAMNFLEYFYNGKIVGVFLDEKFKNLKITDSIIDSIRYIRGIEVAVLLQYEKQGVYRVRIRSEKYDVGKMAREHNGGGHIDAAGYTILKDDIRLAKKSLIEELKKWLEQYTG